MRWFVIFLLIANLALFFWLQHDSRRDETIVALPPPDIGRLQLIDAPSAVSRPAGRQSSAVEPPPPLDPAAREGSGASIEAAVVAVESAPGEAADLQAAAGAVSVAPASSVVEASTVESVLPQPEALGPREQAPAGASPSVEGVGETAAAAMTEPSQVSTPVAPTCAQVGPLSADTADALIARLPVYVALLSDVAEEVIETDSYYVMIPALPSRAAGLETLAALEAAGITDTWLFDRGPRRNAISLGVFSRLGSAERRLRNVTAKGFKAELIERSRRREVRRLLIKNVDGGDVRLSLPLPDGVDVEPRPCP